MGVVVGRNRTNLLNLGVVLSNRLALGLEFLHNCVYGLVNALLEVHGIGACSHVLEAYIDDGLCKDSGGGGAVTCLVVGLGGNLLHHLGAHVLELVFKFHFLCYGYAVLGNLGSTELLCNDNVTAFRSKRYFNCICKCICTVLHGGADVCIEFDFLCHNKDDLRFLDFARNDSTSLEMMALRSK